jgi:hypothetical protein
MSIIGEVRAAGALIKWADAHAGDMPWELSKFSDGTPCFIFPEAVPSRAFLAPRRGRWLLVLSASDAPDASEELDVGGWRDQPGLIVHNTIVSLARFASTYAGESSAAGDFAVEAFRMAIASQNVPATAYAAEIVGDISLKVEYFDAAANAFRAALEAVPRTDFSSRERLEKKQMLASFLETGHVEED